MTFLTYKTEIPFIIKGTMTVQTEKSPQGQDTEEIKKALGEFVTQAIFSELTAETTFEASNLFTEGGEKNTVVVDIPDIEVSYE